MNGAFGTQKLSISRFAIWVLQVLFTYSYVFTIRFSSVFMTSLWSAYETSISMLVASLRCLVVLCSSARKIGPISYTFSKPPAIIICL